MRSEPNTSGADPNEAGLAATELPLLPSPDCHRAAAPRAPFVDQIALIRNWGAVLGPGVAVRGVIST